MVKLTRQTQKIFGKDGNLGRFGSAAAGSPTLSTAGNLSDMQSLAAYTDGWSSAVLGGKKRPPLEEFNTLKYINDYQNSYILQEGIAEYDASTTYYIGSLVKESSTGNIYKSIVDDNIGSALSNDSNWEFQGDIGNLKNAASNTVVINSINDFPTPSAGVITLESGKNYLMNSVVVTTNRFVIPTGGFVRISSNNLSHALVYTGGGVMFTGLNFGLFITNLVLFQAPGGTFFDLDGVGSFFTISTIWQNCATIGSIRLNACSPFFCQFSGFTNGLTFSDRTDLVRRSSIGISHTTFSGGTNAVTDLVKIEGNIALVGIQDSGFTTSGSNESILNLDSSLKTGSTEIVAQSIFNTKSGGNVFAPDSLDQTYINAKFFGCVEASDSTILAEINLVGNSLFTTIAVAGQNTPIATNSPYTVQTALFERFLAQDECTFINGTDTVNTTFNHGLILNDRIFLHTYAGALPAELDATTEYYVVNPLAASFQLSLTPSGSVIDFTDDGSGVLYYRHSTGTSILGHLIYVGLETSKIRVAGWNAITNIDASDNAMRSVVMKIETSGAIVESQAGSRINSDNTKTQSSINIDTLFLANGEGAVIYHRNDTNTDNILTEEALFTINKI